MRIEFLIGGFAAVVGLLFVFFPRQATDLIVAGNYVIGSNRGALMNASQRPWSTRLLGVSFLVFGVVVAVLGTQEPPTPRRASAESWEIILPLVAAGVLVSIGFGVLLSRRRLTALAAQRLRANGGDIYEDPDADRYARRVVLLFATWTFVVAALISAVGVILYFRS